MVTPGRADAAITSYDGSIYERRTDVTDRAQRRHIEQKPWMKPGDCGCRFDAEHDRHWVICINANCSRKAVMCGGYCSTCWGRHGENVRFLMDVPELDFHYLAHQREWSDETFGPGPRTLGVTDHIAKELDEVVESGGALDEWADVVILALDGATRAAAAQGGSVADVLLAVAAKQARNEEREWPDWRTCDPDKAIEHVREDASQAPDGDRR